MFGVKKRSTTDYKSKEPPISKNDEPLNDPTNNNSFESHQNIMGITNNAKHALHKLEIELESMSQKYDDINQIGKLIKIKSDTEVELNGITYIIPKESKKTLLQKLNDTSIINKLISELSKFDGKPCNLFIFPGAVARYFKNNKFRQINSTQWKLFIPIIYKDNTKMKDYDTIISNLYCTRMDLLQYTDGKFRYLKRLEKIDLAISGNDISLPQDKQLISIDDNSMCCTVEFFKKHVCRTIVIVVNSKDATNFPNSQIITNPIEPNLSLWQLILKKINR